VGGLVVTANEAYLALDDLDVSDVTSWRVAEVMRRDLRATTGATGRNVCGGEEQGAEVRKSVQKLVAGYRVEAEFSVSGVNEVLTSETLVVDENIQHDIPNADEAVPGEVCEEKVGVVVVGLVAQKDGKVEVETRVSVGESERDLTLLVGDFLQEGPEHVTDIVQTNDRVV